MILCYDLSEKIAVIHLGAVAMFCKTESYIYVMKYSVNFISTNYQAAQRAAFEMYNSSKILTSDNELFLLAFLQLD